MTRRTRTEVIATRATKEEVAKLQAFAELRHSTMSSAILHLALTHPALDEALATAALEAELAVELAEASFA